MWVLENHPAYIQGFSAAEKDIPSGAFMITPAPCGEYPEGMYEDYAARRKYAEDLASVYGIEIGKETAQDVLVRMRSNRPLPKTPDSPDNEPQSGFDFS